MKTLAGILLVTLLAPTASAAPDRDAIPPEWIPSGILLERGLPLADPRALDGRPPALPVRTAEWRQLLHRFARGGADRWDGRARAARGLAADHGAVPIGVLDLEYQHLRRSARSAATLQRDDIATARVFAASALRSRVDQRDVVFHLDPRWAFADGSLPPVEIDFADDRGFRAVGWDERVAVHFPHEGRHRIHLRAGDRLASFVVVVEKRLAPAPARRQRTVPAAAIQMPPTGGVTPHQRSAFTSPTIAVKDTPTPARAPVPVERRSRKPSRNRPSTGPAK